MLNTSAEYSPVEIRTIKKRCEQIFLADLPDITDGLAELRRVYDRADRNAQTAIHVVTGRSRSCKSTILTRFVHQTCEWLNETLPESEHNVPYVVEKNARGVVKGVVRSEGLDGDERPVVYVSVPSTRSLKAFVKALLTALRGGKPPSQSLNKDDLLSLVLPQLLGQRVKILILDEFHNAVTSSKKEVIWLLSEHIKDIMNETRIQVIVAGLPDALRPVEENEQLDGRCRLKWSTHPFQWGATAQRQADFLNFLDKLEAAMALPEPSNLSEPNRARRIHSYTGGIVGRVTTLIQEAVFECLDRGDLFVSDELIDWAHERLKRSYVDEAGTPQPQGRPTRLRARGNRVQMDYKKSGQ